MVGHFNAAAAVIVDLGDARPLAVAGFAAMHADSSIVGDCPIRHQDRAGVDDHQPKGAQIAGDAVIAVDVGFGAVANLHSRSALVTDYVLRSSSDAVAAPQDQTA